VSGPPTFAELNVNVLTKRAQQKRVRSRREYRKRKARGACGISGCRSKPAEGRMHCRKHLGNMAKANRERVRERKANGLCIYCGERPQFWGVRCVICRQFFVKHTHALPWGARRALRLYREAERKLEIERRQTQARFAIRKLLATQMIAGDYARALRLYAGLDTGAWRSYRQVARIMRISKERVRQLLYASKIIVTEMLHGDVPWPPLAIKQPVSPQDKYWRRPRALNSLLEANSVVVRGKLQNRIAPAKTSEADILRIRISLSSHPNQTKNDLADFR